MSVKKKAKKNSDDSENSPKDVTREITWLIGIGLFVWIVLLVVAIFHPGITARMKFASDSSLNLFIALAVIGQVIIYWKMATQNERLIRASEKSNEVAQEAFHAGEAPYFGIPQIEPIDLGPDPNRYPKLKVVLLNGGKTPAWRIHTFVKWSLGHNPNTAESWTMKPDAHDMRNTFLPAGEAHHFLYTQEQAFIYDTERMQQVENDLLQLFVIVEVHYRDFRRVWHSQVFRAVWNPHVAHFHDYDASSRDCDRCKKKGYDRKPN